jgi:hypothetical protein
MTIISGGWQQVENIQQRRHMNVSSWDQLILSLSREFGKPGHLRNVDSSCC